MTPYINISIGEEGELIVDGQGKFYELMGLLREASLSIEKQFIDINYSRCKEIKEQPNT